MNILPNFKDLREVIAREAGDVIVWDIADQIMPLLIAVFNEIQYNAEKELAKLNFEYANVAQQIYEMGRDRSRDLEEKAAQQAKTIEALRILCDEHAHGALRWEHPLPIPEWIPLVRNILDPKIAS